MDQTRDFDELDWTENPATVGFGPNDIENEIDLELGTAWNFINLWFIIGHNFKPKRSISIVCISTN